MRNYVAVAFDDTGKAYEGLHALWQLDDAAEVTVHGTARGPPLTPWAISRLIPRKRIPPWRPPSA